MERGERDGDLGPDSFSGFQADLCMVLLRDFFHDRETEPGAPGRFGMAFVHPVEPFEDPGLVGTGDTDA